MAAILNSDILFSHFAFKTLTANYFNVTQTHAFWLNLMMAAILNFANLNSTIFNSAILVFPLKLADTCQDWFPPFAQNKLHSFLDSDTLLSTFRFLQKHSDFTLTLTQTNSIWLKLIHSHLILMIGAILYSAILNLAILNSTILVFPLKLTHTCQDWFPLFAQKNFTQSFWLTLMIQLSWNLPSWIQPFCTKKNLTHSFSLNLMMAAILNSAILDSAILHKKNVSHSFDSTRWWQPSWILPSYIQPSWIPSFCTNSDSN